jgi:PAS domain S-box-containing protein
MIEQSSNRILEYFSRTDDQRASADEQKLHKQGWAFDDRLHGDVGLGSEALPPAADQILLSIVENSDDAIITKNLDGIISSWNKAAQRIFGYAAEEVIGESVTILIPPDRHNEEPAIIARIRRGERVDHYETVRQHKDGSLIDISLTISPIKNANGKIIGAAKIARDITERKRKDERIALLARETEHRAKNILATVQALVSRSHSPTVVGLKQAIQGRIQALAKLHTLFGESHWTGAELSNIATQELAPYRGDAGLRVRIDGPKFLLPLDKAQAIGMILHELATNAAKYGSLSVPMGRVELAWRREAERLIVHWTENGGPPVEAPTHQGFGTTVLDRMVREQLDGELGLVWRTEGLECRIALTV